MSDIIGIQGAGKASLPGIDVTTNPILQFVAMQLRLADEQRADAVAQMDYVNAVKKEQELTLKMLNTFQSRYETAVAEHKGVVMTAEEIQWCNDRGIELPWNPPATEDFRFGIDDWATVVQNTQTYLDGLGADTQSVMVVIQDALGQYNAYTQGAGANIHSCVELLSATAKW